MSSGGHHSKSSRCFSRCNLNATLPPIGKDTLCQLLARGASNDVETLTADMKFFTDGSCSELKTEVNMQDLASFKSDLLKTVAVGLLDGTYDK